MASMLAVMALVHLAALVALLLAAKYSVRLVDEGGRPLAHRAPNGAQGFGTLSDSFTHREPEPRPGEVPDPTSCRPGPPKRPEARFLA